MTPRMLASVIVAVTAAIVVVAIVLLSGAGSNPYQVRAIFDNAGFAVPGEDVRIAGANVGAVQSLGITADHRAAVTLAITAPGFTPFHADATCTIRPQSLIAERYVDCLPGTSSQPPLQRIAAGAGRGDYLLPVTRTHSPIDTDIVQNISQQPLRERLTVILDEFGTGLAARGADLNAVIRRADPALAYTDRVFGILDRQDQVLARLASDSSAVLAPLARVRRSLAGFVVQANRTAVASAARAQAISSSFRLFPQFLRQLRPLMVDLGSLAAQGTPLMGNLATSAAAIDRQFKALAPFARNGRPALVALGAAAQRSQPLLLSSTPLARRLQALGTQAEPAGRNLDELLTSLDQTGGFNQLMGLLFNGTSAANGYDAKGHYFRIEALVGDCTAYSLVTSTTCLANFSGGTPAAAADVTASRVLSAGTRPQASDGTRSIRQQLLLGGLLRYLFGGRR